MIKTLFTTTALVAAFATSAHANPGEKTFAEIDVDRSGGLSLEEIQSVKPDVSRDDFDAYDADGSGDLSPSEFEAWRDAAWPRDADYDVGGQDGRVVAAGFVVGADAAYGGQDINFIDLDVDGSGGLSIAEVRVAAPELSQEAFDAFDADRSGELSEAEFDAWLAARGDAQGAI